MKTWIYLTISLISLTVLPACSNLALYKTGCVLASYGERVSRCDPAVIRRLEGREQGESQPQTPSIPLVQAPLPQYHQAQPPSIIDQWAQQPPADLDESSYVPSSGWSQSQQRWRRGQGIGPGGGQSIGPGGGLSIGPGGGLSIGPGGGRSIGPGGGMSIGPGGGQSIGPGGGMSIGPGGGMSIGPGGGQSIGPGGGMSIGPCGGMSIGPACR